MASLTNKDKDYLDARLSHLEGELQKARRRLEDMEIGIIKPLRLMIQKSLKTKEKG